jgi:hypothetical protein
VSDAALAFLECRWQEVPGKTYSEPYYVLNVVDLESQAITCIPYFRLESYNPPPICWNPEASAVYVPRDEESVWRIRREPPYTSTIIPRDSEPTLEHRAENYCPLRWRNAYDRSLKDQAAGYGVRVYPYIGAHLTISRPDGSKAYLRNDYGVLAFGWPGPHSPAFLPNGHEVLLDWWDQLYILDIPNWRLGLVVNGSRYALCTPRFRVDLRPEY